MLVHVTYECSPRSCKVSVHKLRDDEGQEVRGHVDCRLVDVGVPVTAPDKYKYIYRNIDTFTATTGNISTLCHEKTKYHLSFLGLGLRKGRDSLYGMSVFYYESDGACVLDT